MVDCIYTHYVFVGSKHFLVRNTCARSASVLRRAYEDRGVLPDVWELLDLGAGTVMDARELLRRAGWSPGRRVDVDSMLGELESAGHVLVPPVRGFLGEFSGLTIVAEDGRKRVRIDGHDAARQADIDWCVAYAGDIGRSVTPVGQHSHMILMIDENGVFWGGYDDLYGVMGDDIIDLVHELFVGPGSRQLDREVRN